MAIAIYVAFCLLVLWGAVRKRSEGWLSGVLLAIMLLTMPAWVMGMYWVFTLFQPETP